MSEEELVPAKEAAERLGIKYHTLIARIRRGTIAARRIGWALFIHKSELERVINAHR